MEILDSINIYVRLNVRFRVIESCSFNYNSNTYYLIKERFVYKGLNLNIFVYFFEINIVANV